MAKRESGLGRDFYSLLDDNLIETPQKANAKIEMKLISPRKDQPRKDFDFNSLQVLADSITEHGVLQPILLREKELEPGRYEIIAGERRFRAAEMAGLDSIPAIIMTGDDLKVAQIALIENVQRKDLNPVEEAMAYRDLIDQFGLTQDQVASQAGKNRSTVANMLRLLDLPEYVLVMLRDGQLTSGHARALLALVDPADVMTLANRIANQELSVRETERLVKYMNSKAAEPDEHPSDTPLDQRSVYMKELEQRIMAALGRRVKIKETNRKKTVELSFEDDADLENLLRMLGGDQIFE